MQNLGRHPLTLPLQLHIRQCGCTWCLEVKACHASKGVLHLLLACLTAVCVICSMQIVSRLNHLGGCLDMHACFLLQRGLKTLPLRVRQQSANALALAHFLEKQPQVGLTSLPWASHCCMLCHQQATQRKCVADLKQADLTAALHTCINANMPCQCSLVAGQHK